ncbi:MAG: hypothetical protein IPL39_23775 [Opitutaceae bacterium]|nr:hypothetical protein [Opitutaceae bacterium]
MIPLPSASSFRLAVPLALAAAFPLAATAKPAIPDGWFVWPVVEPAAGSALDTSALNPAPAGASGRIGVKDGSFVTPEGRPLRFFGVNLASDDAFPSEADAELLARRLAKAGVNIVRLHHMDNSWGIGTGGSLWPKDQPGRLTLDAAQLDKVHRLIAILARHGIYSNLNLKVSKTLSAADGFPETVAQFPDFQKRVDFFDRRMIDLQKDYARRLLTTKNPYTGLSPAEDPAIAIVEINNENSVLGYFTRDLGQGANRFAEPFRSDLQTQWNAWLAAHYADTTTLAAAWADASGTAAPRPVLDAAKAKWHLQTKPGTVATIAPGADASVLTVVVEKSAGPDWHAQVSTHGLQLEDNTVYTVAFEARATTAGTIGVGVSNDSSARPAQEWRSLGLLAQGAINTEWKSIRLSFPAHSVAGSLASLSFNCGAQPNRIEIRALTFLAGGAGPVLTADQTLEARTVALPTSPSTRQWADWIAFLAGIDRAFAEEMRAFLRDDLGVKAPMVCSQINFSGLPALDREQSMEFADTHVYWQHPNFPGAGWDRANWTIDNSPMVSVFGPRRFGELGNLAYLRVAGKPYAVSEYDHAAPSEYVCEMYPELAVFGCRQNWDALYPFDFGAYGSRNPDGRITSFFDQINHPAKWSLAPFTTRVFRGGLIPPAGTVAELRPGTPVWGEALHFDMLWAKLNPTGPFDFLDCRLQVANQPAPYMERRPHLHRRKLGPRSHDRGTRARHDHPGRDGRPEGLRLGPRRHAHPPSEDQGRRRGPHLQRLPQGSGFALRAGGGVGAPLATPFGCA